VPVGKGVESSVEVASCVGCIWHVRCSMSRNRESNIQRDYIYFEAPHLSFNLHSHLPS